MFHQELRTIRGHSDNRTLPLLSCPLRGNVESPKLKESVLFSADILDQKSMSTMWDRPLFRGRTRADKHGVGVCSRHSLGFPGPGRNTQRSQYRNMLQPVLALAFQLSNYFPSSQPEGNGSLKKRRSLAVSKAPGEDK